MSMGHFTNSADPRSGLEVVRDWNGVAQVVLRSPKGHSARVSLHGGQVVSWKNDRGEELLFTSSKAIFKPPYTMRGGIQMCFPQFGNSGTLERHGFARNRIWIIDDEHPPTTHNGTGSKATVNLLLKPSEDDLKCWPHCFEFRLRVSLSKDGDLSLNRWVNSFADQQCYVNLLPHPMASSKKHSSELIPFEAMLDPYVKCRSPPKILVILNPRSGHGRSSKVFHGQVEPIFKLAGFKMEVVKTTHAGHAKSLVSTIDFCTCPDGIVCVGGDGIVNEVLNGLLCRDDQNEGVSIPIGIIPAGSDNSLVWTVLGVKDPISAALSIVRGGLTPIDVFAVEWIQSGTIHFGTTVSYFGFVSDVLELSEKYQKRFGPLRYFVAGFLKFLCLPKYSFELEYLPMSDDGAEHKIVEEQEKAPESDLYDDVIRRSRAECLPRASSLSSIDSIMSTGIMSGGEVEVCSPRANNEPSELVRALDPKSKRLSLGRASNLNEPEEVLHPQAHSSTPSWRRSKSKSKTEKTWPGLTATNDTKSSRGNTAHEKEDTSSTISDPGPVWDSGPKWDMEPKWDNQPNWEPETPMELHSPPEDIMLGLTKELVPSLDERWIVRKGCYLGVLVCNHSCKTVQSLSSQVVAPKAEYDDNCLDLLLVGGSGRLRLLRFLVLLQFGKHISLPNVEYVKVKSVRLKAAPNSHDGCGIDGELLHVKGQVRCSLLPQQCRLIGRPAKNPV